jgi:hypothetical protein
MQVRQHQAYLRLNTNMPKKVTKTIKEVESIVYPTKLIPRIEVLSQEFGNGDLNVLRDKINEVIKSL